MDLEYEEYIFLLIFIILFCVWYGLWNLFKLKLVDPFPLDIYLIILVVMILYRSMLDSMKKDCKNVNCNTNNF